MSHSVSMELGLSAMAPPGVAQGHRSHILQRSNASNSLIHALPQDIIVEIFLYTCTEEEKDYFGDDWKNLEHYMPIRLGAVCSAWRQLVQSTRRLWSSLAISIRVDHLESVAADGKTSLIEYYFQMSNDLPFFLDLDIEVGEQWKIHRHKKLYPNPVARVIMDRGLRLKALYVNNTPELWLESLSESNNFENLEYLKLTWDSEELAPGIAFYEFASFRGLRKLYFINFDSTFKSPSQNITSITMTAGPIDCYTYLLFTCLNLVEFRGESPTSVEDPDQVIAEEADDEDNWDWLVRVPTETTILPHLQTLHWCFMSTRWDQAVVELLHMPSLKILRIGQLKEEVSKVPVESVKEFARRISDSLLTLEFLDLQYRYDPDQSILVDTFLTNLQNVENLALHCSPPSSVLTIIKDILISSPAGGPSQHFPNLQHLSIVGKLSYGSYGPEGWSKVEEELGRLESSRALSVTSNVHGARHVFFHLCSQSLSGTHVCGACYSPKPDRPIPPVEYMMEEYPWLS